MLVVGHVVVCGLGHLGMRTVAELRMRDEEVVAVGPDNDAQETLAATGVRLVVGDHRLARVLSQAEVETAAAIVLTGDDDLANLNTALAAHELNPRIRIVIRMFDQELGAHISELFPDAVALSSSALAAPGFVSAAIDGETGTRFWLAGRPVMSRTSADPPEAATSIPLARLNADRTVDMLPDVPATDPDLVLVDVGGPEPEDLHRAMPPAASRTTASHLGRRSLIGAIRARFAAPEQRLVRFAGILLGITVASAIFFEVAAELTPLDALSYVITLLTGASLPANIDAASANVALRLYAIVLSLVGAAIVAVVYAFITDALIRSRLLQTLGRRTVPGTIHDHVIVAGLGSIGYRVALGLAARGVPVVAVEVSDDGRFVSATRAAGIPVFIGDARHGDVLDQLHVVTARAVVAATSPQHALANRRNLDARAGGRYGVSRAQGVRRHGRTLAQHGWKSRCERAPRRRPEARWARAGRRHRGRAPRPRPRHPAASDALGRGDPGPRDERPDDPGSQVP